MELQIKFQNARAKYFPQKVVADTLQKDYEDAGKEVDAVCPADKFNVTIEPSGKLLCHFKTPPPKKDDKKK